jgi:hypothetical protein
MSFDVGNKTTWTLADGFAEEKKYVLSGAALEIY